MGKKEWFCCLIVFVGLTNLNKKKGVKNKKPSIGGVDVDKYEGLLMAAKCRKMTEEEKDWENLLDASKIAMIALEEIVSHHSEKDAVNLARWSAKDLEKAIKELM